jgi:hypothetical protein
VLSLVLHASTVLLVAALSFTACERARPATPPPGHGCPPAATACAMPALTGAAAPAAAVAGNGAPRLLEVGMVGCHACTKMRPVVQGTVSRCVPGAAAAAAVLEHHDVAAPDGEAVARRYRVTTLPTLLAVDASGAEVSRLVGAQPASAVAQLVTEVTGRACAAAE